MTSPSAPIAGPDRQSWSGHALAVRRARRWIPLVLAVLVIATLFGSAVAIERMTSRDDEGGLVFVIPDGASSQIAIPTIDSAIVIPTDIRFGPGETARITVRNEDGVANRAGPWVIGPGQSYTARFDEPGVYRFVCSVDAAESVTVTVAKS